MQRKLLIFLFVSSIFLCACVPQEPVISSASPPSIQTMMPTSYAIPTGAQVTQSLPPPIAVNQFPLRQTFDSIFIELTGYRQEQDLLLIEFCYSPPSDEDWLFDELRFTLNDDEISSKEIRYGGSTVNGFPCGSISFTLPQNNMSGNAELSIGQLQTYVIHYDCVKAQKKLDMAQPRVVVKVHCFSREDGEGFRIETVRKPEDMSDEKVADLVGDAFSDVIQINMRFSFRVEIQ